MDEGTRWVLAKGVKQWLLILDATCLPACFHGLQEQFNSPLLVRDGLTHRIMKHSLSCVVTSGQGDQEESLCRLNIFKRQLKTSIFSENHSMCGV